MDIFRQLTPSDVVGHLRTPSDIDGNSQIPPDIDQHLWTPLGIVGHWQILLDIAGLVKTLFTACTCLRLLRHIYERPQKPAPSSDATGGALLTWGEASGCPLYSIVGSRSWSGVVREAGGIHINLD